MGEKEHDLSKPAEKSVAVLYEAKAGLDSRVQNALEKMKAAMTIKKKDGNDPDRTA